MFETALEDPSKNAVRRLIGPALLVIAFGVLGAAVFALHQAIVHPKAMMPGVLSLAIRANISLWTIGVLALIGLIGGYLTRAAAPLVGCSLWLLLPLATMYELACVPASTYEHRLFPIEFVFQLVLALPAVLTAWLGRRLAEWRNTRVRKDESTG